MKTFIFSITLLLSVSLLNAQRSIESVEGYSPQIGVLVSMLEDMKNRVETTVGDMDTEAVDYHFDDLANSVGSLIMHLAATEVFYQAYTIEKRELTEEEQSKWSVAQNLGEAAKEKYKDRPIQDYLTEFDKVRERTLELLKSKDDSWLAETTQGMNNHWAWYHVMEHQSSHLGQILLMKKRLPE